MLRSKIRVKPRAMSKAEGPGSGPAGRISKLRQLVTALMRHERIETHYHYAQETQGYAEKILADAIRHGDKHKPTMETLDYWILEKDLIPKIFKVLAPRYARSQGTCTSIWRLQTELPGPNKQLGVLELKGHPWPPVVPKKRDIEGNLVNVLISAAKKDYRREKYLEIAAAMSNKDSKDVSEISDKLDSVDINTEKSGQKASET